MNDVESNAPESIIRKRLGNGCVLSGNFAQRLGNLSVEICVKRAKRERLSLVIWPHYRTQNLRQPQQETQAVDRGSSPLFDFSLFPSTDRLSHLSLMGGGFVPAPAPTSRVPVRRLSKPCLIHRALPLVRQREIALSYYLLSAPYAACPSLLHWH